MERYPQISMKAARVNANLSQEEAARLLGIGKSTLQSYESGQTVPDVLLSRRMEEVYKFPADYIFLAQVTLKALKISSGDRLHIK